MQVSTSTGGTPEKSSGNVPVFPLGQMALFVMVTVLFFLWGDVYKRQAVTSGPAPATADRRNGLGI